jgi:diguanylate cyclase (GGDEF)-like protein
MENLQEHWVKTHRDELFTVNQEEIRQYNLYMLKRLVLLCGGLMALMFIVVPFSAAKHSLLNMYLSCFVAAVVLGILAYTPFGSRHPRILLYVGFAVLLLFAIYLSVVHAPTQRATILLGLFCVFPLCIVDKPLRTDLFLGAFLVLHTILGFLLKPKVIAFDDVVNCFCFYLAGMVIGRSVILTRLGSLEAQRRLAIEKDTDILTGLFNRRKLCEVLASFADRRVPHPSGVMMLDIDDFKKYNDRYGHVRGDACLQKTGELLNRMGGERNMVSYRYGGEEFVVLVYGSGGQKLYGLAERIRKAISQVDIQGVHVTASIGVVATFASDRPDFSAVVDEADKAMYQAKRQGKNQVCFGCPIPDIVSGI